MSTREGFRVCATKRVNKGMWYIYKREPVCVTKHYNEHVIHTPDGVWVCYWRYIIRTQERLWICVTKCATAAATVSPQLLLSHLHRQCQRSLCVADDTTMWMSSIVNKNCIDHEQKFATQRSETIVYILKMFTKRNQISGLCFRVAIFFWNAVSTNTVLCFL